MCLPSGTLEAHVLPVAAVGMPKAAASLKATEVAGDPDQDVELRAPVQLGAGAC